MNPLVSCLGQGKEVSGSILYTETGAAKMMQKLISEPRKSWTTDFLS
jgi:hypothetical protein